MMFYLNMHRVTGLGILLVLAVVNGCTNFPWKKLDLEGPYLQDSLKDGSTVAEQERGEFTPKGWRAGNEGQLIYDLPGMAQGVVEFDVTGLNRSAPDTTFLTLIETPPAEYINPYYIHNPYKAQVTIKNFQQAPRTPFTFLWTLKNFPSGVSEDGRYVPEVPENGYQKTLDASYFSVFLGQTYHIKIRWYNGVAELMVNEEILAEHRYRPLNFTPDKLQLILGRDPQVEEFTLPDLTFSNVTVSFAKY